MIRELYKGLYNALDTEIPLIKADIVEPKLRPSLKMFFKPKTSMVNAQRRHTQISVMLIYYANDVNNFVNELYEMTEELEEKLSAWVYVDELNLWIWIDELEFEYDEALLCCYFDIGVETLTDDEADAELMQELEVLGDLVLKIKEGVKDG